MQCSFQALLALLAAFVISTPAFAADVGGYLVGMYGQTKFKDIATAGITNPSVDDADTGLKLGGGYVFSRHFAVEGAWVDLGGATVTGRVAGRNASVTHKASGLVVTAVGILPINQRLSLSGRLGLINAEVKVDGTAGASVSSTDMKTTLGIGASYTLTRRFSVRADYDVYQKLGNSSTTGEGDVDMISIGVVYKF